MTGYVLLDRPNPHKGQFSNPRRDDPKTGRPSEPSGLIGVHTAENYPDLTRPDLGAENVASWLTVRKTPGSYHRIVDSDSRVSLAPLEYEVWSDRFLNRWQCSLSMATRAADWHALPAQYRDGMVLNAALVGAEIVSWYATRGIEVPVRRLTSAEALAHLPGFYAHGDSDPSRRTDPGAAFPWSLFLFLVADALGSAPEVPEPRGRVFLPLLVDGVFAHRSITELQRALQRAGLYGGMIEEDYGKAAVFGSVSKYALQVLLRRDGFYLHALDGRFVFYSTVALQRWLVRRRLYPAKAIDGYWGPVTTKGLQRGLNEGEVR